MNFKFGNVEISNRRTTIIAEAGVNHLGRSDYAHLLVDAAVSAGVDIIKFQTYTAEKLTTKDAPRFWNWEGELKQSGSQYDSYSQLDKFSREQYVDLIEYCAKRNIEFMSTPFDFDAVDLLMELGANGFKIASCDITNKALLTYVAETKKPIFLSTGAAEISEIHRAVDTLTDRGTTEIAIMHCTLCYPTSIENANLSALIELRNEFPKAILGLSDHTLESATPSYAVMLGARVIEKHFTFDKSLPLSADHWLSVDEFGMKALIDGVRFAEKSYGSGKKEVLEVEILARQNARRSIVASRNLSSGHTLTRQDLEFKRPGTGLDPYSLDLVMGRTLKLGVQKDHIISIEDLN